MKPWGYICAASCLLLLGCATSAPKQPTPPPGAPVLVCELVPCALPARPPLQVNEDFAAALDDTEAALLSCAVQVLDCMQKQTAARLKGAPVNGH